MQGINSLFYVIVLIMSVVVHEVAHGFAAESQGDPTARLAGRLTMNPLKHIDMIGSVVLPLILVLTNAGFLIGWAKPVPYNEGNLRNKKWGTIAVASAGIITNLCVALFFGIVSRFLPLAMNVKQSIVAAFLSGNSNLLAQGFAAGPLAKVFYIFVIIIFLNLLLALFNLIPIPPLDGSKILFSLIPETPQTLEFQSKMQYLSLPLLLVFIFFIWPSVVPAIGFLFTFITGIPMSF